MTPFHIQLLGGFRVTPDSADLPNLTRPRQQAFLAYLLLHCRRPQARQTIAATFWPESGDAQASKNLRVLLVEMRAAWPQLDHYVQIERTTLYWLPTPAVAVDLFAFEEALQTAASCYQQSPEQAVTAWRTATALYTGDLLPHLYDEWLQPLRQRLAEQYKTALGQLATLQQERGCFADAIQAAQRLQHYDPLSEQACRLLLDCYPLQGEKARALQAYQQYEEALLRELGVEPEADLKARYLALLSQPLPAHQPNRFVPLPPAEPTPTLVGRAQEWSRLTSLWRTAHPQAPPFVLLTGEAGIGKTQLAEQFLRWAKGQGAIVAAAKCYAFGSADGEEALSYAPVVTWLRSDLLSAHLSRLPKHWLTELLRLLPELQQDQPDLPSPEPIRHGLQRKHFFEAVAHAIGAAGRPVLLFVDDLQWCDRETLDWLLYLLLQFPLTTPLLMVGALRSGEIADQHPYYPWRAQLRYHQRWQEVALSPLNAAETTQVAQEVLTQATIFYPPSTTFGELLHRHTEGNPLFIVETMRVLLSNLPREEPTQWTATLHSAIASGALPPKVQAVLEQRLATLAPRTQQLVELGAVIGRAFAANILSELSSDETELVRGLDELLRRQLIREQGAERYDFCHDRLREVVYGRLSRHRRRLLHRQVARAMEQLHADDLDAVSAQIALHYEQAGHPAQAITFYDRAAQSAQRLSAHEEAAGHLRRSLTLARQESEIDKQWGTSEYQQFTNALVPVQRAKLMTFEMLRLQSGKKILDIGCGIGEDVCAIAEKIGEQGQVIGIDLRKNQIEEAQCRYGNLGGHVKFLVGNAYQLDFKNDYFDGCRADRLLQLLERPEVAIAEMVRVVRSGGYIVLHDVDWESLLVDTSNQKQVTRKILNLFCDNDSQSGWVGRMLFRLLHLQGLQDITVIPLTGIIHDFQTASETFFLVEYAERAAMTNLISQVEKEAWLAGLREADNKGNFFSALTTFVAVGRKP